MSIFKFKLKPLPEVLPWEHEGINYLHWFGLTDGIYYLNLKGDELFKYSRECMNHLKKINPDKDISTPYIDYQVIRLHEDLLEILPNVLQDVPGELIDLISSPESEKEFLKEFERNDENDKNWDVYYDATRWWGCRCLTSIHLRNSPEVRFWIVDETVHVRWDNSEHFENGIQIWDSLKGEVQYDKNDFLDEVKSFHNRLMNEMEKRIIEIEHNNPIPHVHLDLNQLKNEQMERRKSLQTAMNIDPDIKDWNKVMNAITMLNGSKKVSGF